MINFNPFSIISILLGIFSFILAGFIYFHSRTKVHKLWALFNTTVGVWGVLLFLAAQAEKPEVALFIWRMEHAAVFFLAVFFYHFTLCFCSQDKKRSLFLAYSLAFLISCLFLFSDVMIKSVVYRFDSFYYSSAERSYSFTIFIWIGLAFVSFRELYQQKKKVAGLRLLQTKYLFYASLIGFISGPTTIIPSYVEFVYPAFHVAIFFYIFVVTYAIFRYQLLDVKLV